MSWDILGLFRQGWYSSTLHVTILGCPGMSIYVLGHSRTV